MLAFHDQSNKPVYVAAAHIQTVKEDREGRTVLRMIDGTEVIVCEKSGVVVEAIILDLK